MKNFLPGKDFTLVAAWFFASNMIVLVLIIILLSVPTGARSTNEENITYSVFSSKPPVNATISDSVEIDDARAAIIDQYFKEHKCPLAGTGRKMVELSDEHNFEFWWLPAIAWQESSCGKNIIDGSYNAWGYGIYGDNAKKFSNWDEAMEIIANDLSVNFFGKGLVEPCEVERRYTPPSKGSWCRSIKYFKDELINYKSPNI